MQPEPELARDIEPRSSSRSKREKSFFGAALAFGAVICVAGGVAFWSSAPATSSTGDAVDGAQRAQIESSFMAYNGRLHVADPSDEDVRNQLQAAPYLDQSTKASLHAELKAGRPRVAAITFWDNFDQDGDVVHVTTGGISVSVFLTHAPQTIFIPYQPGQPVHVTGVVDGGGGITSAMSTSSGPVPLPVMAVGQTIVLPLY